MPGPDHLFEKTRMEALSDGVFSVALTLLIVDISSGKTVEEITQNVSKLGDFLTFGYSALVIGMYWVAHHNEFNLIERPDRPFLWLNLVFLILIVCIPFTTAYLSKNWSQVMETSIGGVVSLSVLTYLSNLLFAGLVLQFMWLYACRRKDIIRNTWRIKDDVTKEQELDVGSRNWLIPCACVVLIIVSFFSAVLSQYLIVLVPTLYITWTLWKPLRNSAWEERKFMARTERSAYVLWLIKTRVPELSAHEIVRVEAAFSKE